MLLGNTNPPLPWVQAMSHRRSFLAAFVVLLSACTAIAADEGNVPPPDATSILFRWCERNSDAQSVRVEFRRFVYDETFKIQHCSTGVLRTDRSGNGTMKIIPVQPTRSKVRGYATMPDEPAHWEWTPKVLRNIDHDRRQCYETSRPSNVDDESVPSAWAPYISLPHQQAIFVPGLVPRVSLGDFRFTIRDWSRDRVYVRVHPKSRPGVIPNFETADLIFSREPVELLAVRFNPAAGARPIVYSFDAPEVEPLPEPPFDLTGYGVCR
jgi:hypothetical protein